jgi:hypothetical protein
MRLQCPRQTHPVQVFPAFERLPLLRTKVRAPYAQFKSQSDWVLRPRPAGLRARNTLGKVSRWSINLKEVAVAAECRPVHTTWWY